MSELWDVRLFGVSFSFLFFSFPCPLPFLSLSLFLSFYLSLSLFSCSFLSFSYLGLMSTISIEREMNAWQVLISIRPTHSPQSMLSFTTTCEMIRKIEKTNPTSNIHWVSFTTITTYI